MSGHKTVSVPYTTLTILTQSVAVKSQKKLILITWIVYFNGCIIQLGWPGKEASGRAVNL